MDNSTLPKDKDKDVDCSKLPVDGMKPRYAALARCDCLIDEYHGWKVNNMKMSNQLQVIALVLTAITPVLVLLPWQYVNIIGAATAAGAAVATGILSIYGYRENFLRYGAVWHRLQTERYLYLERARKEYWESDEDTAARKVANRIEKLVMDEVNAWLAMMEDNEPQSPAPGPSENPAQE